MSDKLIKQLQEIVSTYESLMQDTVNIDSFEKTVLGCQSAINGLTFSEADYQNLEVYEMMLSLKKLHQSVYEKSIELAQEIKSKHQLVKSSSKQILKYRE